MHKLKMKATRGLTFEEGCNNYLEYCRQRNLRQADLVLFETFTMLSARRMH